MPPSKRVAFNEKLKLNDGLLVSAVANGEGISLQEAVAIIEKFVEEISTKIKEKEDVIVHNIGKLFKNAEGRLQFKSEVRENHLEDSFGLPDFFANPIIRDEQNIKLRNKYKDRKAMSTEEVKEEQKQDKQEKKKSGGATIWILTTILVLLGASTVYLFVIDNTQNNMLSSILPASWFKQEVAEVPDTTATEEVLMDSTQMAEEVYAEEEQMYTEEPTEAVETPAVASSGENFLTALTGRYYVIAGAFAEQSNAEALRDELIGKGYDAKVLSPLGRKPLFRVSIADYEDQQSGLNKASTDNAEFGNLLWVMKY